MTTTALDSVQDGLTGLLGATPGAQQWRLQRIHLVNWGGFHGATTVEVDGSATLISGATGSGKSSLLDAWTAVLQQPVNTVFNAASNDAGSKRATGARTVLTYLRGKTGDRPAPGGGTVETLLRPGQQWGGIALVLTSTGGGTYTAGRLFHASSDAAAPNEMTSRWFSCPGDCGLRVFEPYAAPPGPFHAGRLKAALPGIELYPTWAQAADESFLPRLGIGQGGDGRAALRLMHDIQRGAPIPSVNDLFRRRVLDRPGTFDRFDRGIAEFDHLVATHAEFTTIADKLAVLRPIRDLKAEHDRALAVTTSITGYGDLDGDDSVFALWKAHTWVRLLDAETDDLLVQRTTAEERLAETTERHTSLRTTVEQLSQAWATSGGNRLQQLSEREDALSAQLDDVRRRRGELQRDTDLLGALPTTADGWEAARDRARAMTAVDLVELRRARDDAFVALRGATDEVSRIQTEILEQEQRSDNIPRELDHARCQMAQAAGMTADELPFVAELVDLAPGQDRWRVAADAVLGGFARTVLVPDDRRAELQRAINPLRLRKRVQLHSATTRRTSRDLPSTAPDGSLAARLVVRSDSPLAAWLRDELDQRFPHQCVEDPAQLVDDGTARVTLAGQERRGARGAHGGGHEPLIGFTNVERLKLLGVRRRTAEDTVAECNDAYLEANSAYDEAQQRVKAAEALLRAHWRDVDEGAPARELGAVQAEQAELRASDDVLATLERQLREARAEESAAAAERARAEVRVEEVQARLDTVYRRKETHLQTMQRLQHAGTLLTTAQSADLDDALAREAQLTEEASTSAGFGSAVRRIAATLHEQARQADRGLSTSRRDLEAVFITFLDRWPDPAMSSDVSAYPDFEQILDELESHGIEDTRRDWADRVVAWTSEHSVQMSGELDEARHAILERLAPVQAVLDDVPFSARGNRLVLKVDYAPSVEVKAFQDALRRAIDGTIGVVHDDDDEALAWAKRKFAEFEAILSQVRARPGEREGNRLRERLLDVRLHHTFAAWEVAPDGRALYAYETLAGKSGGETQELIAFISGAALRYQLGDDDRVKPRFAPVLLDEAFIKADELTSHRGVTALERLGFQPIVVCPEGSVQALEPHFDRIVVITKGPDERSVVRHVVGLPDEGSGTDPAPAARS